MNENALPLVPVYASLEELLAAHAPEPTLRERTLAYAEEIATELNGDLDRVDPDDLEAVLEGLTEANWMTTANEIAELAAWFN